MSTKEPILEAALRLFALRGVEAVGVQEIVEACQVTKPTLYHHFGSKEGLVIAVLDRGFGNLQSALDAQGPYHTDLPAYLEQQALLWLANVRSQPDFFRLMLSLAFLPTANPVHGLVVPLRQSLHQRFETTFVASSGLYGNMRGREFFVAAGWQGVLQHWTELALRQELELTDTVIHRGLRQFLYGIFT